MSALTGPQPVGAFPFPAGLLLVAGAPEAQTLLVAGRRPDPWPEALVVHRATHEGDLVTAASLASLRVAEDPADPVARYNRWVLAPEADDAAAVREALPPAYAPLVDVVAYSNGSSDELPVDEPGWAPEVRALVLATRAAERLEGGDPATAHVLLKQAAVLATADTPVLAAVLLGTAGSVVHDHASDPTMARADLQSALAGLAGTDLTDVRAELHGQLGSLAHEEAARGGASLAEAIGHYYDGLSLVTEAGAPYVWATLQLNLAAAHLATPMSEAGDRLRLGVAAQSLRSCRRVFTAEEHPAQWSTATLNLANALVYTPSTHQVDNLLEAVALYEEILASGVRDGHPLARARVLANLGNALAHLGVLDDARARLVEARMVFEEHLDHDAAMGVREVLDAIARSEVGDPDQADLDADLARQAGQMSRVPGAADAGRTSGMGVRVQPPADAQRRATVTVLRRGDGEAPA